MFVNISILEYPELKLTLGKTGIFELLNLIAITFKLDPNPINKAPKATGDVIVVNIGLSFTLIS